MARSANGRQHSVRFLSRASLIAALRPSEQEYRQRIANGRFPNLGVGGERQLPIFTTDRLGHLCGILDYVEWPGRHVAKALKLGISGC